MSNPRVWLLTLVYFGQNVSGYGLLFFLPTIVKSFGVSTLTNGVISAIPFVFAAVAMIYWSLRSDRSGSRIMYVAAAGGIALINAVGNLGGFLGPYMFGLIKDATGGSDLVALAAIGAAPVISAIILVTMSHDSRLERIPHRVVAAQ